MAPAWASRALRMLVPAIGTLLSVQFLLGLVTNAYAPSAGFTTSTHFAVYDAHFDVGALLGLLGLLGLVVAVVARDRRSTVLSAIVFLSIAVAGIAGGRFVATTPNDPIDTVLMGIAFLVAFAANLIEGIALNGARLFAPPPPAAVPA